MRIADAKVIICSPDRNFVTLKLVTEDGVSGLGDATLNGRELAVAAYLSEHVVPLLIGRDARRIEDTWQYLYKGAYWRRGPVTMTAIGAVDTALWDIRGKTLGVPVYELLGGASREAVMVYGHANGATLDDTVAAVGRFMDDGFKAVRAQCGVPGVPQAYGIPHDGKPYEPAAKGLPAETLWNTEAYLDFIPGVFERLRRELGPDVHLLHDVHHRLTPIEAARLGKRLEASHLFWMEDPVPAEVQGAFKTIRHHTTTPIAVGEVFNSIYDCQTLIEEELIDYLRMTVVHGGGIFTPAQGGGAGRAAPRANRVSRGHRPEPGRHGGGAALRPERAQLRYPGAHAAHRDDRSRVPARLPVRGGHDAPRRPTRSRRRSRRSAGCDIPVSGCVPAGQPQS